MAFLVSSQWYPLEAALQLCQDRGLVREQVFILGRMGSAAQALHLIIQRLADIPQAGPPPQSLWLLVAVAGILAKGSCGHALHVYDIACGEQHSVVSVHLQGKAVVAVVAVAGMRGGGSCWHALHMYDIP